MAGLRWSPALASFVLFASTAPGQGVTFDGSSLGHGHQKGSKSLTFALGGYGSAYRISPYSALFGAPRVTVIYSAPAIIAVPMVIAPPAQPADDLPDTPLRRIPDRRREAPADLPPPAAAPPPLPGQNAGAFRPLEPDNRERARLPIVPESPVPEPPVPAQPAATPDASLLDRGRAAFVAGQYGRAADLFRLASAADPADAETAFFLVQTLIALDKYTAAAEAARRAVERFPDWPARRFQPRELYGPSDAEYTVHRSRLADTQAAHPDDPVLLFLSGHVLWFDGRKNEARLLFRRAAPAIPAAERFLQALPPAVI